MISPRENKRCYASESQREILLQLITEPAIEKHFFLTGGTALSVFYLHHRISNDLDLFTLQEVNLSELGFWIKVKWPTQSAIIKENSHFLSCVVLETKVDLVFDRLSTDEKRTSKVFENGHQLQIDTIQGIVSNKLCTCVSRTEPKDYIDLYTIFKKMPEIRFDTVYALAKEKDAVFDDPPTAAFQLEQGVSFIKENPQIVPPLQIPLDYNDFFSFYENLVMWIYRLLKI